MSKGSSNDKVTSDTPERISELREKFFKKLNDEELPSDKEFHPSDVNRVKTSDAWLKRFLDHHEQNMNDAFKMLWETCEWRRDFGTNDLNENNVKREYLEDGTCFGYGRDKDGKKMFLVKGKLHVRGSKNFAELQKCIVYWFERLERESQGNQITLFFDMVDAGLSNIDMELTRYLIGLFKHYYPNFLNLILILEMPWILNAAFNIIKTWLPARAIPKIKFIKKTTIKDYVHPEDIMKSWGGNNDYIFEFISEAAVVQNAQTTNGNIDNKKVHFQVAQSTSEQVSNYSSTNEPKEENSKMLNIEPEILTFRKSDQEVVGTMTLTNLSDKFLSYKIKTTTLEKFKVRPSKGILPPGQNTTISIILLPNMGGLSFNDRFLVMALPVSHPKLSAQELIEFWTNNVNQAEQHRIICRNGNDQVPSTPTRSIMSPSNNIVSTETAIASLLSRIGRMEEIQVKIQRDITRLKVLEICFTIVIGFFLVYIVYSMNLAINDAEARFGSDSSATINIHREF